MFLQVIFVYKVVMISVTTVLDQVFNIICEEDTNFRLVYMYV